MSNWQKYTDNPKYLIALIPGLEIARDNLNAEIESIRQAVSGGPQAVEAGTRRRGPFTHTEEAIRKISAAKQKRDKARKQQKLIAASSEAPAFDSSEMTTMEFLTTAVQKLGGQATNQELKAEAAKHPRFERLSTANSGLSSQLSIAINKKHVLQRVAEGVVRLPGK